MNDDRMHAAEILELAAQAEQLRKVLDWLEGDTMAPPEARSIAASLREVLYQAWSLGQLDVLDAAVRGYRDSFDRYCDAAAELIHRHERHQAVACSWCGAEPGSPCISKGGQQLGRQVHKARRRASA